MSAWIASLLSPLARPAIEGPVPLFPTDSNTRGSGKSKLCDLTSIAVTGRDMAAHPGRRQRRGVAQADRAVALAGLADGPPRQRRRLARLRVPGHGPHRHAISRPGSRGPGNGRAPSFGRSGTRPGTTSSFAATCSAGRSTSASRARTHSRGPRSAPTSSTPTSWRGRRTERAKLLHAGLTDPARLHRRRPPRPPQAPSARSRRGAGSSAARSSGPASRTRTTPAAGLADSRRHRHGQLLRA
jgi:hypothetical protein